MQMLLRIGLEIMTDILDSFPIYRLVRRDIPLQTAISALIILLMLDMAGMTMRHMQRLQGCGFLHYLDILTWLHN